MCGGERTNRYGNANPAPLGATPLRTVCVIPARYGSERLPAKPLRELRGRPLVEWVVRAARRVDLFDEVLVATDHEKIASVAERAGVEAVLTDPDLPSGTDRVHAALETRPADIVVNWQGDEPGMPAEAVRSAHASLLQAAADVATACVPIKDPEEFENPAVVKVVRDTRGCALYFSRSPIPSLVRRDPREVGRSGYIFGYKHLGLYIYRRDALTLFCGLPESSLEHMEKLEQLRLLENGLRLVCVETERDSVGVDTEEDVARAEEFLASLEG